MHADSPYLHLRDGGLAENLGYVTALDTLRQDKRAKRKVLIIVDANCAQTDPWKEDRKAGRLAKQVFRAAAITIDSQTYRYREQLVTSNIQRGSNGEIRSGTTVDGIDVVFLCPGLLSDELAAQLKAVGTTLQISKAEQQMLVSAGWKMASVQQHPLSRILNPSATVEMQLAESFGDQVVEEAAAASAGRLAAGESSPAVPHRTRQRSIERGGSFFDARSNSGGNAIPKTKTTDGYENER